MQISKTCFCSGVRIHLPAILSPVVTLSVVEEGDGRNSIEGSADRLTRTCTISQNPRRKNLRGFAFLVWLEKRVTSSPSSTLQAVSICWPSRFLFRRSQVLQCFSSITVLKSNSAAGVLKSGNRRSLSEKRENVYPPSTGNAEKPRIMTPS